MTDSVGQRPSPCVVAAFAALLLPLAVYMATMAPTVYGLDSAELTTGAYCLGITHSPGAPTYMLLGHAFAMLPLGDVGFRLNLLSALFGAATVLVVYRIGRELGAAAIPALAGAGLLAFSFYFWVWALVAELYSAHAFFASAVLLCLLVWRRTASHSYLMVAAFLTGVGAGNHTALILLFPGYALLTVSSPHSPLRHPRLLVAVLLCGIVGLSVFAYFPIRQAAHPPLDYVRSYFPNVDLASAPGLFWMIRGGMFQSLLFNQPLPTLPSEGRHLLHVLVSNFTPFGLLLAVLGSLWLQGRNRVANAALMLMFAFHSGFFMTYGALDKYWMLSVSYIVLAIWASTGLMALEDLVQRHGSPLFRGTPTALAAACIVFLLCVNWPKLNLADDYSARNYGVLMASNMDRHAVFLGLWEQTPILEYLQVVERYRTDIDCHNAVFLDPSQVGQIIGEASTMGRAAYVSSRHIPTPANVELQEIVSNNLYRVVTRIYRKGVRETWQD